MGPWYLPKIEGLTKEKGKGLTLAAKHKNCGQIVGQQNKILCDIPEARVLGASASFCMHLPHTLHSGQFLFSEKTLRRLCEFLCIDYQDSMVHWPPVREDQLEQFMRYGTAYKLARKAGTLLPSTPKPPLKNEDFGENLKAAISKAMPVYLALKEVESDKTVIQP